MTGKAAVLVIGHDRFSAFDLDFQTIEELIDALKARQAAQIDLHIDAATEGDYARIGKVIFSLKRYGFDIAAINGVVNQAQPLP
ncbi:MAG: hypothetical protein V4631_18635 [Pseudomonadota bacterium]